MLLTQIVVLASALAAASSRSTSDCSPRDRKQLSCHASYNISTDSCCFNGALTQGEKQSGLVLATQFWDAQPDVGPADSTTVHGLWPDYCDGTYPAYCSEQSGIPEFNGTQIENVLRRYDPTLLDYMERYYLSNDGDAPGFWSHELNKHGTCFSTLKLHCQKPTARGQSQEEAYIVNFFREDVKRFRDLPTYKWLKSAGIVPSNEKTYTLEQIERALTKRYGAKPYIGCQSNTKLDEFWYYSYVTGPLIGAKYTPTDSTSKSSCQESGIRYLPKGS